MEGRDVLITQTGVPEHSRVSEEMTAKAFLDTMKHLYELREHLFRQRRTPYLDFIWQNCPRPDT